MTETKLAILTVGVTLGLAWAIGPGDSIAAEFSVARNKGQATIHCGGRKYTFSHVACIQTQDRGDYATEVIFSAQPIPYNKLQKLLATEADPSFGDLFELGLPDYLILQLGKTVSFSFSIPGVGIGGHQFEQAVNAMQIEAGRVTGTFTMSPEEILSRQFSFTATVDTVIMTPHTHANVLIEFLMHWWF